MSTYRSLNGRGEGGEGSESRSEYRSVEVIVGVRLK